MKNIYARVLVAGFLLTVPVLSYAQIHPHVQQTSVAVSYTSDLLGNISGGASQGVRFLDNLDMEIDIPSHDISYYLRILGNNGSGISDLTGDIQGVSNIETDTQWQIYEVWFNRIFPSHKSSLLAGIYDLNSEFDVIKEGQLFINSSFGIGPDFSSTGNYGPSIFPNTSFAARLKVITSSNSTLKLGIFDTLPVSASQTVAETLLPDSRSGVLVTAEFVLHNSNSENEELLNRGFVEDSPFRVVIGGWKYSNKRIGWSGDLYSDHGLYSTIEGILLENQSAASVKMLSGFLRTGITNKFINRFQYFTTAGLTYNGLIPGRDSDLAGISVTHPINSSEYVKQQSLAGIHYSYNECTYEFTYLSQLTDWLALQLDSQYIVHPGQYPGLDNAFVIGFRTMINY
ncbi:MAG TPA: hypothetical protein DEQ34_02845 [Balneolaceae bacterium]|nr:hypothetical protein [Balneolaceae bacterium]|tara:strand:- start:132896 stop:134095 length:1200 start_codon:yes stop_codon:yes gene_type:complete